MFFDCNLLTNALFCAGYTKLTRVDPGLRSDTSLVVPSSDGGRTLRMMSALNGSEDRSAPALVYSLSGNEDSAPAPGATMTCLNPFFSRVATPAGVTETRRSSGYVSLGTPTDISEYGRPGVDAVAGLLDASQAGVVVEKDRFAEGYGVYATAKTQLHALEPVLLRPRRWEWGGLTFGTPRTMHTAQNEPQWFYTHLCGRYVVTMQSQ